MQYWLASWPGMPMRSRRRESQTRRKIWRKDVQRIICFLPEDQRCCQLAWLAHGWSCKVCGASSRSGSYWAARGIYGGRFLTSTPPWWCECGSELGKKQKYVILWVLLVALHCAACLSLDGAAGSLVRDPRQHLDMSC